MREKNLYGVVGMRRYATYTFRNVGSASDGAGAVWGMVQLLHIGFMFVFLGFKIEIK